MEPQKTLIETALGDFVERHTGVRPTFKPSKRAHCATSAFLRADAERTADRLNANRADCLLFGAPLLHAVRAENGWLLFMLTAQALDALAARLPLPGEPDESLLSRRLWIWAQHADRPTPDDPALLQGVFEMLFSAPNAEQTLLAAPYRSDGRARVELEQGLFRIAKLLLWERRIQK